MAGWRGRRMVIATSLVTGTLLLVDVWFDVLTSSTGSDIWLSLLSALLIELPLALLLLWIGGRLIQLTGQEARLLAG